MDFAEIRKLIIISMFSDDVLFEKLVLKGGNALHIVHKLGSRTSLDVDFSIPDDFEDLKDTERRIFHALGDRFATVGYVVFDARLVPKSLDVSGKWGGYIGEFKLIKSTTYEKLGEDQEAIR